VNDAAPPDSTSTPTATPRVNGWLTRPLGLAVIAAQVAPGNGHAACPRCGGAMVVDRATARMWCGRSYGDGGCGSFWDRGEKPEQGNGRSG
jgi:hypothetical protein